METATQTSSSPTPPEPRRGFAAWKGTIAVAMSNYIEAGAIIALATSLGLWQSAFGFEDGLVGVIAALSANAFGSAIGAAIGGPLCDRYGRKFIYTYDLILFMIGALLVTFSPNVVVLLIGVILMGIAVGAGVPASWTYIAEEAPAENRAGHVGVAQLAWSIGPAVGFALAVLVAPLGLLGSRLIFAHLFVIAFITWWVRRGLPESRRWKGQREESIRSGERISFFSGIIGLLKNPKNYGALAFLLGVYGLWNTVAGQAGIFQPRVYEAAGLHDPIQQNLLQVLVWTLTALATYFGFMRYGDRINRRWLFFGGALLGVIAWVVLIYAPPGVASMLIFAVGWGYLGGPRRPGVLRTVDRRAVRHPVSRQRPGRALHARAHHGRSSQPRVPDPAGPDGAGRPRADHPRPAHRLASHRHHLGAEDAGQEPRGHRARALRKRIRHHHLSLSSKELK